MLCVISAVILRSSYSVSYRRSSHTHWKGNSVALLGRSGIGAAAFGLITAAVAAFGATPAATTPDVSLAAFSSPHLSGNWIPRGPHGDGGYRNHDWDGNRGHDGGWDGHPWRWWHDSGITVQRCRYSGGHVDWSRHRCEGGRYDDFHIR
jgi:hypothetical protein